jgi:hypothetical protein
MEIVSATATRRDVLAISRTRLGAVAASDMTLRIPVAARDLVLGLPALWLCERFSVMSRKCAC